MDSGAALTGIATAAAAAFASLQLLLLLLSGGAEGFFPNGLGRCNSGDSSHESITETALASVAEQLGLLDGRPPLSETPGYRLALKTIVSANQDVSRYQWWQSRMHFNAEQLTAANDHLVDTRDLAILLINSGTHDYSLARRLVGECLHLLQDFYSNTNWIEQYSADDLYENLGVRGTVITVDDSPCISADPSGTDINNIIYSKTPFRLTSGFRGGQDKSKPPPNGLGPQSKPKGKCSHGGAEDSSSLHEPLGGINKESLDESLSPHYIDHGHANKLAERVSVAFFVHPERGLLKYIGKEKLSALIGLQPSKSIAFVMAGSTAWLDGGGGSSSSGGGGSVLRGLADALLNDSLGVGLSGVTLSCSSTASLYSSSDQLYQALRDETNYHALDRTLLDQCVISQPDDAAIVLVFGSDVGLFSATNNSWWKSLAKKKSLKLFMYARRSTQWTPTATEKLLRELCYETGGGFYYFMDAEDLRQQLVTLPFRSMATARQLHRPNQVAVIEPHRVVVVEGNCSERPYSTSAASALDHRMLTTGSLSTSSVQWLEVLGSNSSRVQLHATSHRNCSATLLETVPYATMEFYSSGAYNQLFAGRQTAAGKVRAVARISTAASAAQDRYVIGVRQKSQLPDANESIVMQRAALCGQPHNSSVLQDAYFADVELYADSTVFVANELGFEIASADWTAEPRVSITGAAYVTNSSVITVVNVGKAAVTTTLQLLGTQEVDAHVALSVTTLNVQPNSSATVNIFVKSHLLAECGQWWTAVILEGCNCALKLRNVIVQMSSIDIQGNSEVDLLPVTVVQCETFVPSTPARPGSLSTQAPAGTVTMVTAYSSSVAETSVRSTDVAGRTPQALVSGSEMELEEARHLTETARVAAGTTTSRSAVPDATSTAAEAAFTSSSSRSPPSRAARSTVTDSSSYLSTSPDIVVAVGLSTSPLKLLGITLVCTVGLLTLLVLSLGGILYMRKLIGTKRFRQRKRTDAINNDDGRWLREEEA